MISCENLSSDEISKIFFRIVTVKKSEIRQKSENFCIHYKVILQSLAISLFSLPLSNFPTLCGHVSQTVSFKTRLLTSSPA